MTEITDLKFALQSVDKELVELGARVSSLKKEKDDLQVRIDNTVVDGLRMRVREFIPSIQKMGYKVRLLRRPLMFSTKNEPWLTGNPNYLDVESGLSMEITEEEALFLSSQDGRQAYGIDCSIWDNYRNPGEID